MIVVDDGSRDDPAAVTAAYPSVKLIRQENQGLSAARNTGMRAAARVPRLSRCGRPADAATLATSSWSCSRSIPTAAWSTALYCYVDAVARQGQRRRWLYAGGPAPGHLSRRCGSGHRAHGDAHRRLHRHTESRGRQHAKAAPEEPMQEVTGVGPAAQRSAHLGSRHDGLAAADRDPAADHAQLPGVRRTQFPASCSRSTPAATPQSVAERRTTTASTSTSTASARRATCGRALLRPDRRFARQSRFRSLRSANTRSSRPNYKAGVRPDLERGHYRADEIGHQRVSRAGPSAPTPPRTSARGTRPSEPRSPA